jgi:hypothetical protein
MGELLPKHHHACAGKLSSDDEKGAFEDARAHLLVEGAWKRTRVRE